MKTSFSFIRAMKSLTTAFKPSVLILQSSILIFLSSYSLTVLSQQQWELIHDNNSDIGIQYVFMYDENHTWGMFDNDVYFSPDGGQSWNLQLEHDGNYYQDIQFLDSLTGYCVLWSYVYKTVDGGNSWNLVNHNVWGISYTTLYFLNADTGWVAGDYSNINVTYDGGQNWTMQNIFDIPGNNTMHDIHFFDAMHGCTVGGSLGQESALIMTTSDGGANWTEIVPESLFCLMKVQFINQQVIWCCNRYDDLFRSDDGGYTWQQVASLGVSCLDDLHFFNDTSAIAVTSCRSYNCVTADAWMTWQQDYLYSNNVVENISFCNDNDGIGVSMEGHVIRTNDGGRTWKRINEEFEEIGFFSPMNGWLIQSWMNKNFMHTTDGGFTWHEVETGHSGMLLTMDILDDHIGYAISDKAELLKTTDAGDNWEILDSALDTVTYTDMQFIDENTGFMCAVPAAFYRTVNGGQSWVSYPFDSVNVLTSLEFINAQEGWVGGYGGFLGHTIDGGVTWEEITMPNSVSDIEFISDQKGFIILYNATGYQTDDGGASWQQMDLDLFLLYNIDFPDNLHGWISGTGRLLYTDDGGDTWDTVIYLPTGTEDRTINGIFALDYKNAWICTARGSVYSCADFVGIKEDKPYSCLQLYPNPVRDLLNIDPGEEMNRDILLQIYSPDGKLLLSNFYKDLRQSKISLDLTGFPTGLYLLKLTTPSQIQTSKFLKL